jgi:hypothetical protein
MLDVVPLCWLELEPSFDEFALLSMLPVESVVVGKRYCTICVLHEIGTERFGLDILVLRDEHLSKSQHHSMSFKDLQHQQAPRSVGVTTETMIESSCLRKVNLIRSSLFYVNKQGVLQHSATNRRVFCQEGVAIRAETNTISSFAAMCG